MSVVAHALYDKVLLPDGTEYKLGRFGRIIDIATIPAYLPWGDQNYGYLILKDGYIVAVIVNSGDAVCNVGMYLNEPVGYGTYQLTAKYANAQNNMYLGWGFKDYSTQSDVIEVYHDGVQNKMFFYTVVGGSGTQTELTDLDFTVDRVLKFVWDASSVKLYVDGVLKATRNTSPAQYLYPMMNVRTTAASAADTAIYGKDWVKLA